MLTRFIIGNLRVSPEDAEQQAIELACKKMKRVGFPVKSLHLRLYKRSVDARHRDDIKLVCSVLAQGELTHADVKKLANLSDVRCLNDQSLAIQQGQTPMRHKPLVVGMGPAGLFCALLLAENGYAPVLIDRGDSVTDRVQAVERFTTEGILDTDSNIQFGAGGAGTFSDGKLVTRINDPRCSYVLKRLHDFGAPDDILTRAKPHIGTDVLRHVVDRIIRHIESLGGMICYRTKLIDFKETPDGTLTAVTSQGEIDCSALVLALGHSARDTYRVLIEKQLLIEPKPISVGVRIEHLKQDIDRALYGTFAGHPSLGPAEYALSDTTSGRGVYTFCMCPGGQVVPAASEERGVVVNGMSHHARDGINSNCAVAVSVRTSDFESVDGSLALGAIAYQRHIEQAAFLAGGSDYSAPIQTVGDFLSDSCYTEPSRILPTYRNGTHVKLADLSKILPPYVTKELKRGLVSFDKKINGFSCPDAVLSGAETRTSAPVRILRTEESNAVGHPSIYPCGEGAGYAGGITSAAVDGLQTAQSIIKKFKPFG